MLNQRFGRLALAAALAAMMSACVTLPPNYKRSPQDPWESWNRGVYKFNDALDRHIAKPVAKGYVKAVPAPMRTGIHNFFTNLKTPTVMINDFLQGKFLAAANDLGRFLLNTTVGIGGLLDPASAAGLDRNEADFGLTFGHWGIHSGPFVELPILGPSSLRDLPGLVLETYTDPRHYIKNNYVRYGLYVVNVVDKRASLLSYDKTLQNVYDPYAFIRDAYLARRAYLATGKSPTVDDEPLVDPEPDAPSSKPTAGPAPADAGPKDAGPGDAEPGDAAPKDAPPEAPNSSGATAAPDEDVNEKRSVGVDAGDGMDAPKPSPPDSADAHDPAASDVAADTL